MDIEALKEDWTVVPDTITVSATTTAAKVAFWVFGELEGQGAQDGYGQGSDTLEADLPGGARSGLTRTSWSRRARGSGM